MATFDSLPNEILITIAKLIPYKFRRPDYRSLARLALTSRRLHQLIDPILYDYNRLYCRSSAIEWAAAHGRIDTLEKALSFGLKLHYHKGPNHDATLCVAIREGQKDTVTWLLDHGATPDVEPVIERYLAVNREYSPLCIALDSKQPSVARLLIERGACLRYVESRDASLGPPRVTSALHVASYYGQIPIIKLLVQHKSIDINTPDSTGMICLHHAIDGYQNRVHGHGPGHQNRAVIDELIRLGADINWNSELSTPLCFAVLNGCFEVAHRLIDAGSRINVLSQGLGLLHMCTWKFSARELSYTLLERLISLGADVNGFDLENQAITPLGEACKNGTAKAIAMLLQAGAKVDLDVGRGQSPVEVILEPRDEDGWVVIEEHMQQALTLLMRHRARLDSPKWHNTSPLKRQMLRYIRSTDNSLEFLLGLATKQNLSTEHLDSMLDDAIEARSLKCCKLLLAHGARMQLGAESMLCWIREDLVARKDRNRDRTNHGYFDSQFSGGGFQSFITMAINFNLGFDNDLLTMALQYRDMEAVDAFLSHGIAGQSRGCHDSIKWLKAAVEWGHLGVLHRLLRDSPNVNGFDDEDELPLSRAVQAGHPAAALLLIEYGADAYKSKIVQIGEKETETLKPIQHAIRRGEIAVLTLIIDEQGCSLSEEEAWVPAVLVSAPEITRIISMQR